MIRCKHDLGCAHTPREIAGGADARARDLDERVARIERILYRLRHYPWAPEHVRIALAEIDIIGVPRNGK